MNNVLFKKNRKRAAIHPGASSNVSSVRYDSHREKLNVTYRSTAGVRNYTYSNVPPKVYDRFRRARSPGKFVWNNLRGGKYPVRRR